MNNSYLEDSRYLVNSVYENITIDNSLYYFDLIKKESKFVFGIIKGLGYFFWSMPTKSI